MCNCISLLEEALKRDPKTANTALDIGFQLDIRTGGPTVERMQIATCKRDSNDRQKKLPLFCGYCPACGERYVDVGQKESAE